MDMCICVCVCVCVCVLSTKFSVDSLDNLYWILSCYAESYYNKYKNFEKATSAQFSLITSKPMKQMLPN